MNAKQIILDAFDSGKITEADIERVADARIDDDGVEYMIDILLTGQPKWAQDAVLEDLGLAEYE